MTQSLTHVLFKMSGGDVSRDNVLHCDISTCNYGAIFPFIASEDVFVVRNGNVSIKCIISAHNP